MKSANFYHFLIFVVLASSSCSPSRSINVDIPVGLQKLQKQDKALHFFVVGDWGREGKEGQQEVANMMDLAGYVIQPDFIVSVGDNFYPEGVSSVDDPQFQNSYELVYKGKNLFCPWYLALGNHDYIGDPEAQIAYAKMSNRWNMPDRYYYIDEKVGNNNSGLRLTFIDTSPFDDPYHEKEHYAKVRMQDTTAQKSWFDQTLKNSTAEWDIVIGHHPLYTSGLRKTFENHVRKHINEVLQENKVDAYFAGHEHDLQHQKPDHIFTNHFVSGAGSSVRKAGELPYTKFAESVSGFMIVSLTIDQMMVQVVSVNGEVIYTTTINKEKE